MSFQFFSLSCAGGLSTVAHSWGWSIRFFCYCFNLSLLYCFFFFFLFFLSGGFLAGRPAVCTRFALPANSPMLSIALDGMCQGIVGRLGFRYTVMGLFCTLPPNSISLGSAASFHSSVYYQSVPSVL